MIKNVKLHSPGTTFITFQLALQIPEQLFNHDKNIDGTHPQQV